jgi:hypothetical protein
MLPGAIPTCHRKRDVAKAICNAKIMWFPFNQTLVISNSSKMCGDVHNTRFFEGSLIKITGDFNPAESIQYITS